jgi:glycosyltransferase involved in cell wall biosynthesis
MTPAGGRPALAFVGALVPEGERARYPAHSPAGQQFQRELLRVLAEQGYPPDRLISLPPVASFPRDRRLLLRRRTVPSEARLVELPVVNLGGLKPLTAGVATVAAVVRWARERGPHDGGRIVLGYNASNPSGWAVVAGARAIGARAVLIAADVPVPGAGDVPGTLSRRLEARLHHASIRRFDGIVALSPYTLTDYGGGAPGLLLEGGVAADLTAARFDARAGGQVPGRPTRLAYTGRLTETAGIDLLLGAFALLEGAGWRLTITGWGEGAARVGAAAAADPRIEYLGRVERSRVLEVYARADILVNPHLTAPRSARYAFPSKLLEYLATGRPTVTTALPWIAAEYGGHCRLLREETPAALAATVSDLAAVPEPARLAAAAAARSWVLKEKSWDAQGERLAAFLTRVSAGETRAAAAGRV